MSTLQSSFSSPSSFLTSSQSQQLSPKKTINLTIPQHRKSLTTPSASTSFSPNGGGPPKDNIITPESNNDNNNAPQTSVDCNANGGPDIIIRRPTRRILPRPRPLTPSLLDPSASRLIRGGGHSPFVPLVYQYPSYITPATYFVSLITQKHLI